MQALLGVTILALALHVCSWSGLIVRLTATIQIVVVAIVATQATSKVNTDNLLQNLLAKTVKPALQERASADYLSRELVEQIVDPEDSTQGCAIFRLSEEPTMTIEIADSSRNFMASIKDCKQKSFPLTKPD